MQTGTCFGFFGGDKNAVCRACETTLRCKSVTVSNGFDATAELLSGLVSDLDQELVFKDSDRVEELASVLMGITQGRAMLSAEKFKTQSDNVEITRRVVSRPIGRNLKPAMGAVLLGPEEATVEEDMLTALEEELTYTKTDVTKSKQPLGGWKFENL